MFRLSEVHIEILDPRDVILGFFYTLNVLRMSRARLPKKSERWEKSYIQACHTRG
jgi:hypothetical protein